MNSLRSYTFIADTDSIEALRRLRRGWAGWEMAEGEFRVRLRDGGTVRVDVAWWRINLIDADRNDRNPRVVKFDINKGNKQIAHAIDRVLRPVDLP